MEKEKIEVNEEPKKDDTAKIVIIIVSVIGGLILVGIISFAILFSTIFKTAGKAIDKIVDGNVVNTIIDETKNISNEIQKEMQEEFSDNEYNVYQDNYIEITSKLLNDYTQELTINDNEKIVTEGADDTEFEVDKINEYYLVVTECDQCQVTTENGYIINRDGHIIAKLLPNEIELPKDSLEIDGMLVSREVELENNFIVLKTTASSMQVFEDGDLIGTKYYFTVANDTLSLDHYENSYYKGN